MNRTETPDVILLYDSGRASPLLLASRANAWRIHFMHDAAPRICLRIVRNPYDWIARLSESGQGNGFSISYSR